MGGGPVSYLGELGNESQIRVEDFIQDSFSFEAWFPPYFGHIQDYSELVLQMQKIKNMLLLTEIIEEIWCTRSDSNARPTEPESVALSN